MRRLLATFALVLGLGMLPGCGTTGLELHISVPDSLKPGADFNAIRVRVDAAEGGFVEEKYPISDLRTPPYVVYIYADGATHYKVSVRAELWQDNALKKTELAADVQLSQHDVTPLNISFK